MSNFHRKAKAQYQRDGMFHMALAIGMVFIAFGAFINLKLIFFGMICLILAGVAITLRGDIIMEQIKKIKEILKSDKTTSMKLDAIARHLKVKLVHVPEHFACRSIEKKEGANEGTN